MFDLFRDHDVDIRSVSVHIFVLLLGVWLKLAFDTLSNGGVNRSSTMSLGERVDLMVLGNSASVAARVASACNVATQALCP